MNRGRDEVNLNARLATKTILMFYAVTCKVLLSVGKVLRDDLNLINQSRNFKVSVVDNHKML